MGSPADQLVAHMLRAVPADKYCAACWESFLQQNPPLEGIIEEELGQNEAGMPDEQPLRALDDSEEAEAPAEEAPTRRPL